jgi:tRNA threonylcarbamoyladenosine biosynthesis protein TsaB
LKILGIDTSSEVLSIALSEDRAVIVEENHQLDRRHSSLLVPKIKEMLEGLGLSIDNVGAFVIGLGPGSFTGLRIGVSTVKGLAIAKKKPCIGVPSIDAMALNVDKGPDTIVPLIDAKRQQVYSAIYKKERNRIIRKSEYLLLSVDKLMKKIKQSSVFLGDGLALYRDRVQDLNKKAVFLDKAYWYPRASNLIRLAGRYKKTDLSKLRPMYLYPKDCQVKRGHNLRSGAT